MDHNLALMLERIGEVARALRWREAVGADLNPLQLRILGFILAHPDEPVGVARLASELQVSRPTVSDSVATLVEKGLLRRKADPYDGRSHHLRPSAKARRLGQPASPLDGSMAGLSPQTKEAMTLGLMRVLHALANEGKLQVQRMCWTCAHYRGDRDGKHHCLLLGRDLEVADLRMDCPEHETA